jgi:hypothetical protein
MNEMALIFTIIGISCFLAMFPALIASSKGHDFVLWWLFGAFFLIIALPCAIFVQPTKSAMEKELLNQGMRPCPFCGEIVHGAALICRHCRNDLTATLPDV